MRRRSRSSRSGRSGGDEDARHLGARERARDRLGVGRAHDHRPARAVRLAERFLVADAVEDERVAELDFALDRDLRDPTSRRAEPALAHA